MSGPLTTRRDGDLLWLTLDDPDRRNALSPSLIAELTAVFEGDLRGDGVRAVLLGGAGRHFSAGADLEHLAALADFGYDENREDSERLKRLFESILRQEALTVALVQGACVAGGCGLATACDFVVASEDARFMYSETRIGFVAALVATFLPLRVRGSDIRELLLNPDFVAAPEARRLGLVDRVVPLSELTTRARALAVEVLTKSSSESIARTKRLILEIQGLPLAQRLDLAAQANAAARMTDDCKRGIATFLETKATPLWREPED